jgi:putative phage-type endonuclease
MEQEQIAERMEFVGASEAPVIMGVSPWKTINELWEEKLGLRIPPPTNHAQQRGLDLEEEARAAFQEMSTLSTEPIVIYHPTIPFMRASLDGMDAEQSMILEIKCPGKVDHELAKKGLIPSKYFPQLMHQLACAEQYGIEWVHYFSYLPGDEKESVHLIVPKDNAYIKEMIAKEKEFWNCVETLVAPKSPIPEINNEDWKEILDKYLDLKSRRWAQEVLVENLKAEEEQTLAQLVRLTNGQEVRGFGFILGQNTRKGQVDYGKVPHLKDVDLEQYRKAPTTYWTIKKDKG